MEDNLVYFKPNSPNLKIIGKKEWSQKRCKHNSTAISEVDRTFRCVVCGCYLEPFDYLWDLAITGEKIGNDIFLNNKKKKQLEKEISELESEIKRLKSRVSYYRKKGGE